MKVMKSFRKMFLLKFVRLDVFYEIILKPNQKLFSAIVYIIFILNVCLIIYTTFMFI